MALANIIFHPIFFRCCCIVLCIMPGYLCVLCVYVVADRGRCVQLWPLFPLPPVISETYPTVLSILARYWSAFIWCTVSSDTESNNIFRYEHWTYILCPVAGLQLDFHLMPSLMKYSFPCHAINLRFLSKIFLHINFTTLGHVSKKVLSDCGGLYSRK